MHVLKYHYHFDTVIVLPARPGSCCYILVCVVHLKNPDPFRFTRFHLTDILHILATFFHLYSEYTSKCT